MKLIFCLSNLFVPTTLTLINQAGKTPVMVYTDQDGIKQFFDRLELKNVTVFYREEIVLKKNIKSIRNYIQKRNRIFKELDKLNFKELYFFHNTFGEIENWMIKRLSNKVKVFHVPLFNDTPFKKKNSLKAFKGYIKSRFINNTQVLPLYTGERFIYKISNSFFNKIHAIQKEIPIDNTFIKELIDNRFDFADKKIVLLTGTVVELNQVKEDEYIEKINSLINLIGVDKILAKPHPRFPNRYGLEKKLELVPHFIPANVLFAKFKIFIGYTSMVLTEAANEGLLAVSLVDFFTPVLEERKDSYKQYLLMNLSGKSSVQFFSNLKDVKKIDDFVNLQ